MNTSLQKMKYIIFFYLFLLSYITAAQSELWGMTSWGGDGAGVIFKTDIKGENQEVLYKFPGLANGFMPDNYKLCLASNGKFYGTAERGGVNNGGVIYEFDQATNTYTKLYDFMYIGSSGSNPYSGVMQAANGKLYGTTPNGGLNHDGTLYEFDIATKTFTKLYDFDNANGYPSVDGGEMIQASNGKLYGTTTSGASAWGVVFEFDLTTKIYKKLYTFPQGHYSRNLIELPNGKLYGVSAQGGTNYAGCIYTIDPATADFATVYDFTNSTVKLPWCSLVLANNGKLYGTASNGGANNKGGLFQFNPADNTCTILYNFNGTTSTRSQGLIQAANGKLYGMTSYLGNDDNGTIFEFNLTGNTYTVLYNFDETNGRSPASVLTQASNGKLYSTLRYGGYSDNNGGVIFEFNLTGNVYTPIYKFGGAFNGANPFGSLTQANSGKIYGMTQSGGVNELGVIFSMDVIQHTFTKLYDFESTKGNSPEGSFVKGSNGMLYATATGGPNAKGVIFQFNPTNNTYTKRYDFDGTNGAYPSSDGSLISASNGKLYGITAGGGANNVGVIFEYDPATNIYTKCFDFNSTNGEGGDGKLMQAANGKIYGTTYAGGVNSKGVLFEFDPTNYAYTKLYDFTNTGGNNPLGKLAQDTNGKLYGTTSMTGTTNAGVFFEFDIPTKTYTELRAKGSNGGLIEAASGKIYGMTGTEIFEYTVNDNTFTDKTTFTGVNGSGWLNLYIYNSLSLVNTLITGIEKSTFEQAPTFYPNPTTDKITIDLKRQYSEISASIYDITGKSISKTTQSNTNQLNVEIDGMPGFYLIEIHTQEGNTAILKVVKQ